MPLEHGNADITSLSLYNGDQRIDGFLTEYCRCVGIMLRWARGLNNKRLFDGVLSTLENILYLAGNTAEANRLRDLCDQCWMLSDNWHTTISSSWDITSVQLNADLMSAFYTITATTHAAIKSLKARQPEYSIEDKQAACNNVKSIIFTLLLKCQELFNRPRTWRQGARLSDSVSEFCREIQHPGMPKTVIPKIPFCPMPESIQRLIDSMRTENVHSIQLLPDWKAQLRNAMRKYNNHIVDETFPGESSSVFKDETRFMAPKISPYPYLSAIVTFGILSFAALGFAEAICPPLMLLIIPCQVLMFCWILSVFKHCETKLEQEFYCKYESIPDGFIKASEVLNQVWINNTPEYVNMNAQSEHTAEFTGR